MSEILPMWIQAIGSAGSLLGFAGYVWVALLTRKDHDEIKREEQAQGVAAWLDPGFRHDLEADYVICVYNGGVSPIFQCRTVVSVPGDEEEVRENYLHIIPPRRTILHTFPADVGQLDETDLYSSSSVPELEFTDSYGDHWRRRTDGKLTRSHVRSLRRRRRT